MGDACCHAHVCHRWAAHLDGWTWRVTFPWPSDSDDGISASDVDTDEQIRGTGQPFEHQLD